MEIVRQIYAALTETGEPAWSLIAPDFEYDTSDVLPDLFPGHGHEGAGPTFRAYTAMFDDFHIDLEEVIAANDQHVVTAVKDGGRIKGTEAEVQNPFFHAFTLRDGKVIRWSSHLDRASALGAVGIADPTGE